MAVKAFVQVQDSERDSSTTVKLIAKVNVLGEDIGDLEQPDYMVHANGVGMTSLIAQRAAIAAAVQTDMEGHGIEFELGDTVFVYPLG